VRGIHRLPVVQYMTEVVKSTPRGRSPFAVEMVMRRHRVTTR
jgi:hypothetical protein